MLVVLLLVFAKLRLRLFFITNIMFFFSGNVFVEARTSRFTMRLANCSRFVGEISPRYKVFLQINKDNFK